MADAVSTHPYRGEQTAMFVTSSVMCAFGVAALILRLMGRCWIVRKLGADDYFMVAGVTVQLGYLFEILYGSKFGIGLHTKDDTPENMVELLKIIYAIEFTYNTAIYFVKMSIVCFYLRLATIDGGFRKSCHGMLVFLTLFFITTQICSTVQCLPIAANWDISGKYPDKHCINTEIYFYVIAACNIVIDLTILSLPIKTLRSIKRSSRDKYILYVIFGVGGFSCIASMIRLYTIKIFALSKDPFYDGVPINIWSMIEVNIAIVCASVPAMKPVFTKGVRSRHNTSNKSNSLFPSNYGHQMMPLSGEDNNNVPRSGRFRNDKAAYSVNATANDREASGSEENIVMKGTGVINYEREFTVEESYIGSPRVGS